MDISYKTIIEYLCSNIEYDTNKTGTSNFTSKKNIMISAEKFPDKIQKIFNDRTFFRFGVTQTNTQQKNISFLTSLLTLLEKDYVTLSKEEEMNQVSNFKDLLKEKIKDKKFDFELNSKFSKQIILSRLDELNFEDGVLIQVISQILSINFIVFDFENEKINCLFSGDYLNPWKPTYLFAKKEQSWEPIFSNKKNYCFNDNFLNNLLTTEEIYYYNENYLNKSYCLLDNIYEISNVDEELLSEEENSETCFVNVSTEIKSLNLNKTKLKNMKKDSLLEIMLKLNLDATNCSNKNNLIEKILPFVN